MEYFKYIDLTISQCKRKTWLFKIILCWLMHCQSGEKMWEGGLGKSPHNWQRKDAQVGGDSGRNFLNTGNSFSTIYALFFLLLLLVCFYDWWFLGNLAGELEGKKCWLASSLWPSRLCTHCTEEWWHPTTLLFLLCFPAFVRRTSHPADCFQTQNNSYGLKILGGTQRRCRAVPVCYECGQLLGVWGELPLSSGIGVRTILLSASVWLYSYTRENLSSSCLQHATV